MGVNSKPRRPRDDSLERLEEALARSGTSEALAAHTPSRSITPARSTASFAHQFAIPLMAVLLVVLLWMGATAGYVFLIPALFTEQSPR